MNKLQVILLAIIYSQVINIFETIYWIGGFWRLKPPFFKDERENVEGAYHTWLALMYVVPFLIIYNNNAVLVILGTWITWMMNDLTWHLWAVKPKYWLQWIKYYFNPYDNTTVWHARLWITSIKVSPRKMFYTTMFRAAVLPLLLTL